MTKRIKWIHDKTCNQMRCFNDPAWESLWWGGVADTNYLYPARWGWIKKKYNLLTNHFKNLHLS